MKFLDNLFYKEFSWCTKDLLNSPDFEKTDIYKTKKKRAIHKGFIYMILPVIFFYLMNFPFRTFFLQFGEINLIILLLLGMFITYGFIQLLAGGTGRLPNIPM